VSPSPGAVSCCPSQSDDWEIAIPESVGLDSATLRALDDYLATRPGANVHCVLLARRGVLVHEKYFHGEDVAWGRPLGQVRFDSETKHDLRSITKSVVALLTGIAIDRKMIRSVDEPVFEFLPAYADLWTPQKKHLLVRHLLTMSAGLEWDQTSPYTDPANSEIQMIYSRDPRRFVIEAPIATPAGTAWCFSGGVAELLGAVLEHATGRQIDDSAREFLFEPIGIVDFEWIKYVQTGLPAASSGLRLRPRDMAKVGQLLLQRGRWNGHQIVPSQWIDACTAPQIGPPNKTMFYGYHWWLGRSLVGKREVLWSVAVGLGGQRIYTVPALDIVMVTSGGWYTTPGLIMPMELFNSYVLAAIKDF